MIGGAFWTPSTAILGNAILGNASETFDQLIQSLFANGEQGFVYDPNDLSKMFQNNLGAVPVTDVGQSVAYIKNSGRSGNNATQSSSSRRPILRKNAVTGANYLEFDGVDDFLSIDNIDLTTTNKVTVIASIRKLSDARTGVVYEFGNVPFTSPFNLLAPDGAAPNISFTSAGATKAKVSSDSLVAPISCIVSATADLAVNKATLRVNGNEVATTTVGQGANNYGNEVSTIGGFRSAYKFRGHIYGLIVLGRLATDNEIASIEKELAKRAGVTLNV